MSAAFEGVCGMRATPGKEKAGNCCANPTPNAHVSEQPPPIINRPTIDAIPEDTTPLLRTTSCTAARHPTPPLSLRTPAATRRRPSRAPLGDEDLLPPVSPDRRLDSDTPSPPPKRTRTVVPPPTARAILQHSVSLPATLATGGGGAASAGRQASGRAAAPLGGAAKPPRSPTDEPIGLWAPGVLGVIPPPPRSGLEETNMRCISVWMNGVALALDQPLMQALEVFGEGWEGGIGKCIGDGWEGGIGKCIGDGLGWSGYSAVVLGIQNSVQHAMLID